MLITAIPDNGRYSSYTR